LQVRQSGIHQFSGRFFYVETHIGFFKIIIQLTQKFEYQDIGIINIRRLSYDVKSKRDEDFAALSGNVLIGFLLLAVLLDFLFEAAAPRWILCKKALEAKQKDEKGKLGFHILVF